MQGIDTILIANRGEIASRIIRTCRRMGIRSVAVFSDPDRNAPFTREADQAIRIGPGPAAESYLDQEALIEAARTVGADAIHPGYGFLAEHADFARRCAGANLIFIGPRPEAIEAMGSKSRAKALMREHEVPVIPGYEGSDQRASTLEKEALRIGFPLLIKAAAGGGGKGMRIVRDTEELQPAIESAVREARSAFGDDELILEKYIERGRHIEFQIFGDRQGNLLHLMERECSLQRRYQKIMEESPSPVLDDAMRQVMGEAALRAARALQYDNAGTVEFILDEESGEFYFLEVNTRLQVEHPVTEAITGLDLVRWQIEAAQGMPLQLKQEDLRARGYAMEVRLYAEEPERDFLPSTGRILRFEWPEVEGLRVESAVRSGSEVSVFYDPMIAKLVVHDQSRHAAHRKMRYVLERLVCLGVRTNQAFLLHLLRQQAVREGRYHTRYVETKLGKLAAIRAEPATALAAACLWAWQERQETRTLLRGLPSGWRNSFNEMQSDRFAIGEVEYPVAYRYKKSGLSMRVQDRDMQVGLIEADDQGIRLEIDGRQMQFAVARKGARYLLHSPETGVVDMRRQDRFPDKQEERVDRGYEAPMPSQVLKVLVSEGKSVRTGDPLVVLMSMKMENTICAASDGKVEAVFAQEGSHVEAGFALLRLVAEKS